MRNLFQLIYRHHVLLVFLLLLVGCFILTSSHNRHHRAVALGSANRLIGSLQEQRSEFREYVNLREVNEQLARANTGLRNDKPDNFVGLNDRFAMVDDTLARRKYRFMTSKVINNSVHRQKNFITLDKGSRHGVKPDMGVMFNGSVVGIVKEVSEHYSVVIPILNNTFKASVRIKNSGEFGLVRWDGRDEYVGSVDDIPKHVPVRDGDTIVTTGFSTYFPPDIMVGTVKSHEIREGDNFYTIDIILTTPFRKLQYVDIVENLLKDEQEQLENQVINSGN